MPTSINDTTINYREVYQHNVPDNQRNPMVRENKINANGTSVLYFPEGGSHSNLGLVTYAWAQ